jgi:hypothetical protein
VGAAIKIIDAGIIMERYRKVKGITGHTHPGPASPTLQITAGCWASGLLRDARKPSYVSENGSKKGHTYQ